MESSDDASAGRGRSFKRVLIAVAVIGAILSLIARFTFFAEPPAGQMRIAVVGASGEGEARSAGGLARGVRLAVDQINASGGVAGNRVGLKVVDDGGTPEGAREAARKLVEDDSIVAVVGHSTPKTTAAAAPIYDDNGIPLISPLVLSEDATQGSAHHFTNVYDTRWETRFLANYVRNIKGHKIASVIRPNTERTAQRQSDFDATYRRFGTKLLESWTYPQDKAERAGELDRIARSIKERQLPGVIVLLGSQSDIARSLLALRAADVNNPVAAPSAAATNGFLAELAAASGEDVAPASLLDGVITTTPLLFDIANEQVQQFRSDFKANYRARPGWLDAYSYEAARLALDQLKGAKGAARDVARARERVQQALAGRASSSALGDELDFGASGRAERPVRVGRYEGTTLISALIQLQPMRTSALNNFLQQVKEGRALYVNDRFMYKTKVVYTGLKLNGVNKLNPDQGTAELDFLVWFRSRSPIEPDDVVFGNAVGDGVELGEPVASRQRDDMVYRAYRVQGQFKLNAGDVKREYGHELVGINYRHAELSRNNVLFVTDVLGMQLGEAETLTDRLKSVKQANADQAGDSSSFSLSRLLEALGGGGGGRDILAAVTGAKHSPLSNWLLVNSWLSQDAQRESTLGDPVYVGYGRPDPVYSQIGFGMMLRPDEIDLASVLSNRWFAYIAIFALVAALAAVVVDRRRVTPVGRVQTLALSAVAWPLLLLACGNLAVNYAIQTMSESKVDGLVLIYNCLWWLVPAALLHMALIRLVWEPLERRTEQIVPRIIRMAVAALIYLMAGLGILAFVLDQKLTSLLATSGVLVTIVGLAIQANIANIFSGIVLNIERPFRIGDLVSINNTIGKVVDITWRTVRLELTSGPAMSLPNDVVSQAQVVNYTLADAHRDEMVVHLPSELDPEMVVEVFTEAIEACESVVHDQDKIVSQDTTEVTQQGRPMCLWRLYFFHARGLSAGAVARNEVWRRIWAGLRARGVHLDASLGQQALEATNDKA